jgi:molybdopterin converting factor subunit 1
MKIRTLFFASYREQIGTGLLELTLQEPSTVSGLLEELRSRGEPFSALPPEPVVAVNREFASLDTPLSDGDEVALVPPVAGG